MAAAAMATVEVRIHPDDIAAMRETVEAIRAGREGSSAYSGRQPQGDRWSDNFAFNDTVFHFEWYQNDGFNIDAIEGDRRVETWVRNAADADALIDALIFYRERTWGAR